MERPLDREEYERWRAEASRALRHGELAAEDGLHYMPARYPDAHPAGSPGERYGSADAAQALDDARAVISLVDEAWDELEG